MPTVKEKHARANATWYQNNTEKRIQYTKDRRKEFQDRVDQIKLESGCVDCNYDDHPRALDFDHLRDKEFSISTGVNNGYSWERLLAEMSKCEIRCANCHRIKTANLKQN